MQNLSNHVFIKKIGRDRALKEKKTYKKIKLNIETKLNILTLLTPKTIRRHKRTQIH